MNKQFLLIGSRVFAVAHIVAIKKGASGSVYLWTTNDTEPWEFEDEEAATLWRWAEAAMFTQKLL